MPRALTNLTAKELATFRRRLDTPPKIQQFLDDIPYNTEDEGETLRSPRRVLRDQTANCIEGAVLAAAAPPGPGDPPADMDLTAVRTPSPRFSPSCPPRRCAGLRATKLPRP